MANETYALFDTTEGSFKVKLYADKAPKTVQNFTDLAEGIKTGKPFYDGIVFHRVIPDFMIQAGDPLGDGSGGPGYTFADEGGAANKFERSGLLAMANRGPDTNGSQFFVTVASTPHLNGLHTVFGDCGNPEVVEAIAATPRDEQDRPTTPVVLERVVISVQ